MSKQLIISILVVLIIVMTFLFRAYHDSVRMPIASFSPTDSVQNLVKDINEFAKNGDGDQYLVKISDSSSFILELPQQDSRPYLNSEPEIDGASLVEIEGQKIGCYRCSFYQSKLHKGAAPVTIKEIDRDISALSDVKTCRYICIYIIARDSSPLSALTALLEFSKIKGWKTHFAAL